MMVLKFIVSYYVLEALLIVGAILFTVWARKKRLRSLRGQPPTGFIKTEEIFVDPTTGIKEQVWFNPQTGQRYYETVKE
jgi:hypothetical protein